MPPTQSSTPPAAAAERKEPEGEQLDGAGRVDYLNQVMAEIDAEVRRRRASGDLPAGLERELDELFLEFSPVGLQGKARLRETLALVDGSAYVDTAVPTASEKALGGAFKRTIRKALGWYIGFIVHQIVKFAWAVSRMFHVLVDHVEDLEAAVESQRTPELPASAVPRVDSGAQWWCPVAVAALDGVGGRVLHAECGTGSLLDALLAIGVDAYGVDPNESDVEIGAERGLDVRAESVLDHLAVVADEALAGLVLSGSVQWLDPGERERLVDLLSSRLALDGVLVVHSTTPHTCGARHQSRADRPRARTTTAPRNLGASPHRAWIRTREGDFRRRGESARAGRRGWRAGNRDERGDRRGQRLAARPRRVRPGRRPGAVTAVHQFVPALLPRDATGDHTLALREALRAAGWSSDIYVEAAHDDLWSEALYFERYPERARPDDILLYQLSTASPVAEFLLGREETLVLDYHNVTPASFYEGWEDHTRRKVALAREQAAALASRAALGIADSAFNAAELEGMGCRATAVVPIIVDTEGMSGPADESERARVSRGRTGRRQSSCSSAGSRRTRHSMTSSRPCCSTGAGSTPELGSTWSGPR